MNWLHRFMSGRYGVADGLSIALISLMLILSLLGMLTGWGILSVLSYIPFGLYVYRTFSRDIYRRQEENRKFMEFAGPYWRKLRQNGFNLRGKLSNLKRRWQERKTYLYLKCPKCKTTFLKKT